MNVSCAVVCIRKRLNAMLTLFALLVLKLSRMCGVYVVLMGGGVVHGSSVVITASLLLAFASVTTASRAL
eukprot:9755695-Alexandrium_andersonii.AAC.1